MPTLDYVAIQAEHSRPREYVREQGRQKRCMDWFAKFANYQQARVLDCGTRDGWALEYSKSLGSTSALGVELVPEVARFAKDVLERNVICADMQQPLEIDSGVFDVVQSMHSLEHTEHPWRALVEMKRLCRKGGWLCVAVPEQEKQPSTRGHFAFWPNLRHLKRTLEPLGDIVASKRVRRTKHHYEMRVVVKCQS